MSNSGNPAPFRVSSQVTIASGGSAVADSGALAQPNRQPYWVDEISWVIRIPLTAAQTSGLSAGALINTKLNLGRHIVSADFIPIHCYAPCLQSTSLSEKSRETAISGVGNRVSFSNYRWKLPKPLFVPPGMPLVSGFQRIGDGFNSALVTVSYGGRYVSKYESKPKEIDVPYVSAFLPDPSAAIYAARSNDKHLGNDLTVPLHCQRIMGRATLVTSTVVSDVPSTATPNQTDAQIVMKDSSGVNIIRDFLGFSRVFDSNRRAWTFNRILEPNDYYQVYLQLIPANVRIQLALIGSRKVVI